MRKLLGVLAGVLIGCVAFAAVLLFAFSTDDGRKGASRSAKRALGEREPPVTQDPRGLRPDLDVLEQTEPGVVDVALTGSRLLAGPDTVRRRDGFVDFRAENLSSFELELVLARAGPDARRVRTGGEAADFAGVMAFNVFADDGTNSSIELGPGRYVMLVRLPTRELDDAPSRAVASRPLLVR